MNYICESTLRLSSRICDLPEIALFSRRRVVRFYAKCLRVYVCVSVCECVHLCALSGSLRFFTFTPLSSSRPFKKLLAFNNSYLTVALSLTSFVIRSVFASVSARIPCSSVCETNLHGRFSRL